MQSVLVVFDFFQNALKCVISANSDQVIQYLNFSKELTMHISILSILAILYDQTPR